MSNLDPLQGFFGSHVLLQTSEDVFPLATRVEGSHWTIRSNSPYDPYDPTLPLVWYHGHWLYDDFIAWVEKNRGFSDRCGIVYPNRCMERRNRGIWQREVNMRLALNDADWRVRDITAWKCMPRDTIVVFETLGLLELVKGFE